MIKYELFLPANGSEETHKRRKKMFELMWPPLTVTAEGAAAHCHPAKYLLAGSLRRFHRLAVANLLQDLPGAGRM